jgi:hypothetical protein
MSVVRFDADSWLPDGAVLYGEGGFGVLAEDIPSGGESGPGYCYNDLDLPADTGREICGRIASWPAAGTLTAGEDTSFTFTGAADGTYSFTYQLYVDGVAVGSPATVTLTVGSGVIACNLGAAVAGGQAASIDETLSCALGTATAAGHQAAVAAGATIACGLGTAAAVGYTAALDTAIACAPGVAAAAGHQATVADGNLSCALGTATAAGHAATVTGSAVDEIVCALGTATAEGYVAYLSRPTLGARSTLRQAADRRPANLDNARRPASSGGRRPRQLH